ncbi:DUF1501 domain-containing protein [soil metagenome]
MAVSRRTFLGLAAGGAATGAGAWAALLRDGVHDRAGAGPGAATSTTLAAKGSAARAGRVLVVLQLSGGNDGLNTVIPTVGRYHDLRPTLGVADEDLVALKGTTAYGLHPSLDPLTDLWAAGHLAALQGVGYDPNIRSHFAALDWWWSATPGRASATGWLGRWLDATAEGSGPGDPLRAVSIGGGSPALRAQRSLTTSIIDPASFALATPRGADADDLVAAFLRTATAASGGSEADLLARAQAAVGTSVDVVDRLTEAGIGDASQDRDQADERATGTDTDAGEYVAGDVTTGLAAAANLVGHRLGTQVIVVNAGGFDTHANQADTHQRLLADLAGGIASFTDSIAEAGLGDEVLLVTTSEFGRRAAENGSGTDHGNGGTSFLVGNGVKGQVAGTPDLAHLDAEGDVAAAIDVRSLYATALTWLGGPTEEVLGKAYDTHGLLA